MSTGLDISVFARPGTRSNVSLPDLDLPDPQVAIASLDDTGLYLYTPGAELSGIPIDYPNHNECRDYFCTTSSTEMFGVQNYIAGIWNVFEGLSHSERDALLARAEVGDYEFVEDFYSDRIYRYNSLRDDYYSGVDALAAHYGLGSSDAGSDETSLRQFGNCVMYSLDGACGFAWDRYRGGSVIDPPPPFSPVPPTGTGGNANGPTLIRVHEPFAGSTPNPCEMLCANQLAILYSGCYSTLGWSLAGSIAASVGATVLGTPAAGVYTAATTVTVAVGAHLSCRSTARALRDNCVARCSLGQ